MRCIAKCALVLFVGAQSARVSRHNAENKLEVKQNRSDLSVCDTAPVVTYIVNQILSNYVGEDLWANIFPSNFQVQVPKTSCKISVGAGAGFFLSQLKGLSLSYTCDGGGKSCLNNCWGGLTNTCRWPMKTTVGFNAPLKVGFRVGFSDLTACGLDTSQLGTLPKFEIGLDFGAASLEFTTEDKYGCFNEYQGTQNFQYQSSSFSIVRPVCTVASLGNWGSKFQTVCQNFIDEVWDTHVTQIGKAVGKMIERNLHQVLPYVPTR